MGIMIEQTWQDRIEDARQAQAIIAADRQLRRELEAIEDPKLRAECLRAF